MNQTFCPLCKSTFSSKDLLEQHDLENHNFPCKECKRIFASEAWLNKHLQDIHKGEKPYSCDVCKKAFSRSSFLTDHMRIHTGVKPFSCDVCEKAFTQRRGLSQHIKTHTSEKPYRCDICQKSYSRSDELSRHNKSAEHLKRKTSGNKDPQSSSICKTCGKSFQTKPQLKMHEWEESLRRYIRIKKTLQVQEIGEGVSSVKVPVSSVFVGNQGFKEEIPDLDIKEEITEQASSDNDPLMNPSEGISDLEIEY